jgi:hypothetical protein
MEPLHAFGNRFVIAVIRQQTDKAMNVFWNFETLIQIQGIDPIMRLFPTKKKAAT